MSKNEIQLRQSDGLLTVVGSSFKLISQSWEALRLNLMTFVQLYLTILLPTLILLVIIASQFIEDGKLNVNQESVNDLSGATIAMGGIALVSMVILGLYIMLAAVITQLAGVRNEKIGFKDAIEQAHPRIPSLIALSIITLLAVLGGAILFIIPGLIIYVLVSLAVFFMVDKNLSAMDAFKQCFRESKKHWKLPTSLLIVQLIIQLPADLGTIGSSVAIVLSIAYFCLPAIVYTHMIKE